MVYNILSMPHYTDYRYDDKEPPMRTKPMGGDDLYDTEYRSRRKYRTHKRTTRKTDKRRDGGKRRKRTEKTHRRRR
jgi:hypothetical protein